MTALVPVSSGEDAPLVSLVTGRVAAMIRVDGVDAKKRLTWYVIRLAGADGTVTGRVIGVYRNGNEVELNRLEIAGGAIGESRFSVPHLRGDGLTNMYLDLCSTDLALRVEAPPPIFAHAPRAPRAVRAGFVLVLAGALAAGGGVFASALPRPALVAAPAFAAAGDTVQIAYTTRGVGTASYAARSDDGRTLSAAPLTATSGNFSFLVPRELVRRRIDVRIDLRGPLGNATGETGFSVVPAIAMLPPAPPRTARVAAFSAHSAEGDGTPAVLASYLAIADSGMLTVTNATGRVVGRGPFSRGGTTRIALAPGASGGPLVARIEVRRGASRASSEIGLPPLGAPHGSPPIATAAAASHVAPTPDEAPISADDAPAGDAAAGDEPFAVQGPAVAGRPITIVMRRAMAGMHLRLADSGGVTVAEVSVPFGAQRVSLVPPPAARARTYYLSCTFGAGNSEESAVRSIRVAGRP